MNIQDHPAFKELTNIVSQLTPDRKQELLNTLTNQVNTILTVKDVSDILNVHELTVRRWIQSGELRATRIKGYKIDLVDFAMFLEGRRTKRRIAESDLSAYMATQGRLSHEGREQWENLKQAQESALQAIWDNSDDEVWNDV